MNGDGIGNGINDDESESLESAERIQGLPGIAQGFGDPSAGGWPDVPLELRIADPASGPYGRTQVDQSQVGSRPWAPVYPPSQSLYSVSAVTGAGTPVYVPYNFDRPCVLSVRHELAMVGLAAAEFLTLWLAPWRPPAFAAFPSPIGSRGLGGLRAALFVPTPGYWYVGADSDVAGVAISLQVFDLTDETLLDVFRDDAASAERSFGADAAVGAADAVLVDLPGMARLCAMDVQNTGANPVRINFGVPATATEGYLLAAGASASFASPRLPLAALHAFSALGTTVAVTDYNRST